MTVDAPGAIPVDAFRSAFLTLLEEIFETRHDPVLDPGETLRETLASITAEEASRVPAAGLAPISAQVAHIVFLIDEQLRGQPTEDSAWADAWRLQAVSADEWSALRDQVGDRYERVRQFVTEFDSWDANYLGGALALLTHCAYHLGQIREALGIIRGG
jgi:hypothetical protein